MFFYNRLKKWLRVLRPIFVPITFSSSCLRVILSIPRRRGTGRDVAVDRQDTPQTFRESSICNGKDFPSSPATDRQQEIFIGPI